MGVCEAEKWTDMTYQLMQFIKERSNQQVSFKQIKQTFPYLNNVDQSLVLEEEDEPRSPIPTINRLMLSEIKATNSSGGNRRISFE